MEHLTKQQLILVALLVSFMTSIATGVVTVSLMQQVPDPVIQTINRVVERTIETVVQAPENQQAAAVVTTKETIVVKEDDRVMQAVDKNGPNIVRIKSSSLESARTIALGLLVSGEGLVVTSSDALGVYATSTGLIFDATVGGGATTTLSIVAVDTASGIAILKAALPLGNVGAVVLGNSDQLKLGQTVLEIGGRAANTVKSGIVSSLPKKEVKVIPEDPKGETKTEMRLTVVETDLTPPGVTGAILTNLSGEVVGIALNSQSSEFLPINVVKAVIESNKKAAP